MFSAYDEVAEWYEQSVQSGLPIHAIALPTLLDMADPMPGERWCDLGCGQGITARALARGGAQVTGIDLSTRLLDIAQQYEDAEPLGIVYVRDDAQTLAGQPDAAFDGIACMLALMDIPDLNACLHHVARLLRPGGRFLFAITHPCFQTPESRWTGQAGGTVKCEVRGYFREGLWRSDNPHGVRGKVGATHRMLSTYLNALVATGLICEQMAEPQAQDEVAGRVPGYYEVPVALVARCRKS